MTIHDYYKKMFYPKGCDFCKREVKTVFYVDCYESYICNLCREVMTAQHQAADIHRRKQAFLEQARQWHKILGMTRQDIKVLYQQEFNDLRNSSLNQVSKK